ncbi:MAG: helix-turn-helix domain containing protein [Planctomycetia bacterium]|nr:helix-turn-helix domain containing protein [Planctomycetia bacterium]
MKKSAQEDSAYRMATRLHAVILNLEGRPPGDVAEILKVNRTNVPAWIRAWNQYGIDGLLQGHRCGRPAGLSLDEKKDSLILLRAAPSLMAMILGCGHP